MRCENLSREKRISISGCIMGSQCQTGIKKPSQSRGQLKYLHDKFETTQKKMSQNEAILGRTLCKSREKKLRP